MKKKNLKAFKLNEAKPTHQDMQGTVNTRNMKKLHQGKLSTNYSKIQEKNLESSQRENA